MRRLIAAAGALVASILVGFGIGVALERNGRVDPVAEPDPATVRDSRAFAFDCPEGHVALVLGRADRVVAIGRDDDGDWLQLRSPIDPDGVVWLPAAQLELDGASGGLPVQPCGDSSPPSTIPPNPADDRPRPTTTRPISTSSSSLSSSSSSSSTSSSTSSSSSSTSSSSTSTSSSITLPTSSTSTSSTTTSTTAPTLPPGGDAG